MPLALALCLAAVLCTAEWYAVGTPARARSRRLETVTKPAATLSVLLVGLAAGLPGRPWGWLVVVGLLCGLAGDVLLLDDGQSRFLAGAGAFLVGHLLYVVAFLRIGLGLGGWLVVAALVCLGCLVASRRVLPTVAGSGDRVLTGAVTAYTLVLSGAALVAGATGHPLVALGACLFLVSDTVLAVDRFVGELRWGRLAVMATYLLAQLGIVVGAALA